MADIKFVPTFIYDHAVGPVKRALVEKEWLSGYNRCCNVVNEKLNEWNEEYGDVGDEADYNRFIAKKYRAAIAKAGVATKRLIFSADTHNEDGFCEIVARIKGTATKVRMRLKEIEM